uniref:PiggyBac transposable element-derived protein domain-containing protein n=1 Tax=Knipowitschia caucasica TaxID=637954 RepID=A0AAV2KJ11_KNICA
MQLTTWHSPYYLLFRREARYPSGIPEKYEVEESRVNALAEAEELWPGLQTLGVNQKVALGNKKKSQQKGRQKREQTGQDNKFHVGDFVLLRNIREEQQKGGKLEKDMLGPFRIFYLDGKTASLKAPDGTVDLGTPPPLDLSFPQKVDLGTPPPLDREAPVLRAPTPEAVESCKYLHLLNNHAADIDRQDKHWKMRWFLNYLTSRFQTLYEVNGTVSVDESMIKFKGHLSFRQYLPMKPTKWGIKVWVMAESSTGYVTNVEVYCGREGKH